MENNNEIINDILKRLEVLEYMVKEKEEKLKEQWGEIQTIKPIKDQTKVRTFRVSTKLEEDLKELHKEKFYKFTFQDLVNTALTEFLEKYK